MELNYFKEFAVLAETNNFWEAAERLYMNQSTLSKHIKYMEQELGVPLFCRTTRQVHLTRYGEALLPYAQSIMRTEFEYSTLLMQLQDAEKGVISLGSIPAMAQYRITELLEHFQREYPACRVRVREADPNELIELLMEQRCELIFTREPTKGLEETSPDESRIVRIPYMTDHMVALLPGVHPLAARQELSLRELKEEHFCFIKESSLMYDLCIEACQAAGFIPQIAFTSHRFENIFDMVSSGSYVALVMNPHAVPFPGSGAPAERPWRAVPIVPRICSQVSLCYRKGRPLTAAAQKFVDFCTREFKAPPSA